MKTEVTVTWSKLPLTAVEAAGATAVSCRLLLEAGVKLAAEADTTVSSPKVLGVFEMFRRSKLGF